MITLGHRRKRMDFLFFGDTSLLTCEGNRNNDCPAIQKSPVPKKRTGLREGEVSLVFSSPQENNLGRLMRENLPQTSGDGPTSKVDAIDALARNGATRDQGSESHIRTSDIA
jgi:hypothetical protein